jgi:hypothetical protein
VPYQNLSFNTLQFGNVSSQAITIILRKEVGVEVDWRNVLIMMKCIWSVLDAFLTPDRKTNFTPLRVQQSSAVEIEGVKIKCIHLKKLRLFQP